MRNICHDETRSAARRAQRRAGKFGLFYEGKDAR